MQISIWILGTPVITIHWGQVPGDDDGEDEQRRCGVLTCPACQALISVEGDPDEGL